MKRIAAIGSVVALLLTFVVVGAVLADDEENAFKALNDYFNEDITQDDLNKALSDLFPSLGSNQGADDVVALPVLAGAAAPTATAIPISNLQEEQSANRYEQRGQYVRCGGVRMPGLTVDQLHARYDYLCDNRTNEWILIQRQPIPPFSEITWDIPLGSNGPVCDPHIFGSHPTYTGTLTRLNPGYDEEACKAGAISGN